MFNRYRIEKENARQLAIMWQNNLANNSYTWMELMEWEDFFSRLAKRYGLTREFMENGII